MIPSTKTPQLLAMLNWLWIADWLKFVTLLSIANQRKFVRLLSIANQSASSAKTKNFLMTLVFGDIRQANYTIPL